ncbi:MAG TPA: DUF4157 domain-containing protein [Kofleriaceae bacterium]|nr:DUF4157 domain-containing protein [Kofleriaceae bacterium]
MRAPVATSFAKAPAAAVQAKAAPTRATSRPVAGPRPAGFELTKIAIEAPRAPDPATLVEDVRRAPAVALPHRAAAARLFATGLDGIEAHTGERAARACRLLGASALAVHNVVVFADDAPSFDLVVHEVAHVLQQDGLGDRAPARLASGSLRTSLPDEPAEREASALARAARAARTAPAAPAPRPPLRRAAIALYRASPQESTEDKADPPKQGAPQPDKIIVPSDLKEPTAKRLWIFARFSSFRPQTLKSDAPRFGTRLGPGEYGAQAKTSADPWEPTDYVKYFAEAGGESAGKTTDATATPAPAPKDPDGVAKLKAAGLAIVKASTLGDDVGGKNLERLADKLGAALWIVKVHQPVDQATGAYAFVEDTKPGDRLFDLRNPEVRINALRKAKGALEVYAPTDKGKDLYGIRNLAVASDDAKGWKFKYSKASEKTFNSGSYAALYPGEKAEGDLLWAFAQKPELLKVFGLVRVGSEDARTYAFVVATDDEPYQSIVSLVAKKAGRSPELIIKDYEEIRGKIPRAIAALPELDGRPKDDKKPRPDAKDAENARHELIKRILIAYPDSDGAAFFKDIIDVKKDAKGKKEDDLFGSRYARIKGNLFEKWVFRRLQGKVTAQVSEKQPYFVWDAVAEPGSQRFKKARHGDGRLITTNDKNVILEAKAYTSESIPTLGNEKKSDDGTVKKDDDLVLQMRDYARILGLGGEKPIGWELKNVPPPDDDSDAEVAGPDGKGDPRSPDPITFEYILYAFPDLKVAENWQPALFKILTPRYATDPVVEKDDKAAKDVRLLIGFNPSLTLTVPKGTGLEHKMTAFPGFKQPGVALKEATIKLALPGKPLLAEGSSLVMDVDMKGLKQEGVKKPIEPVVDNAAPAGKPGTPAPKLNGRAENKFSGLKSKLDDFLKRVHTDARLIDGGVEAEISITDGPSGIPGLELVGTILKARYTLAKGLAIEGTVGLQRPDKKITGKVTVKYEANDWTFDGEATVQNLIAGLDPFTVKVHVRDQEKWLKADRVAISRKLGGVTLSGALTDVSYDLDKRAFGAKVHLDAAMPAFGKIGADGLVADNDVQQVTFSYESKELKYPAQGTPIIAGTLNGSVTYEKGKFSGHIGGDARLNVPALEKIAKGLGDLAFKVDVNVSREGKVSGSIATAGDKPIEIGKYFRIPSLRLDLHEDGTISSKFSLEVVNIKYVKEARVDCEISPAGFKVLAASAKAKIGDETKDRVAAELGLSYNSASAAFIVSGTLWVRIKEGMVAKGEFTWDSARNQINAKLGIDKITLLAFTGEKTFLKLKKQIPLVSIYGLGIYLDVRFELGFKYGFNLAITPTVELQGLSLDDFSFQLAVATVKLEGLLEATLVGTPGVGLGLFVLSPTLLRGGGGIKVPIAARAAARPQGTVQVRYKPDGTLEGGGRVGVTLTFGIKGQIKPYAELSVLNGAYEPTWEGDSLYDFTILEERELFTYFVDFGAPLAKETNPSLPGGDSAKPPPPRASDEKQRFGSKPEGDKGAEPAKGQRNTDPPKSAPTEEAKKEGGFDFKGMVDKLLAQPKFAPIKKVLQAASDTWDAITGFFGKVVDFFKKWFDVVKEGVDAFVEAIRTIAKEGVLAYFKKLLQRKLGPLYDIIAPLFDALEKVAGKFDAKLEQLLASPIPTTPGAFLAWTIDTLADVLSIAVGGIGDLAAAVVKVFDNAAAAAGRFVDYLVKQGKIGVRRHVYYIPGLPNPLGGYIKDPIYFYAPTEYKADLWGFRKAEKIEGDLIGLKDLLDPLRAVEKAIAFGLWKALQGIPQVQTTADTADDDRIGEGRKNYWA